MDYCMIEIAFDKKEETMKVVEELLNTKTVASCQVIESDSYWNWKNEKENSKEYLLMVKTKKSLIEEVYKIVKKYHSYECFEFAIFDISSCSSDYLKWIDNDTK